MAESCGYKTVEADVKDKLNYKKFMAGKIDSLTINGKTFSSEPMTSLFGKGKKTNK